MTNDQRHIHLSEEAKDRIPTFTRIRFADIEVNMTPTKAELYCEILRDRDPISGALRVAIMVIGKRLHELGGLKLMQDALDAVLEAHPEGEGYIAGVVDHRWDGIGDDKGRWWA